MDTHSLEVLVRSALLALLGAPGEKESWCEASLDASTVAGWLLGVGVVCDMQTREERATPHININNTWNVCRSISWGYQNQTANTDLKVLGFTGSRYRWDAIYIHYTIGI